tara:strand:+ start:357 stop:1073 length:717 start_codon:yes stop_codon:yes gene_type:complete
LAVRIFRFDNSIAVPRKWLTRHQIKRYKSNTLGILHEPEEEGYFLKSLNSLKESGAYVNIGAAWGYYSLLSKKTRPEIDVFAVEAHPKMCSRIMEGSMINGVTGISVLNSAVVGGEGLNDGPMKIKFGYGASVVSANSPDDADSMAVKLVDITRLLESVPNSDLLVSMDVQGSEAGICKDLAADPSIGERISSIIVGTHGDDIHEMCRECLVEAGFSITLDEPAPKEQPDGIILASRK